MTEMNATDDAATDRDAEELRASADHLRAVLEAIDSGTLEATGQQRAFIAGALCAIEVMPEHSGVTALVEPRSNDRLLGGVPS